jgi:hypothetical protein
LKSTEPQQVVPETITWVDLERTDNLTQTLRLKTTEAITGKFNYLKFYLGLYGADLYAFDPALFRKKLHHAMMLGIAAGKKEEAVDMINALPITSKGIYKSFVTLVPSGILNTLIRSK